MCAAAWLGIHDNIVVTYTNVTIILSTCSGGGHQVRDWIAGAILRVSIDRSLSTCSVE